MTFSLHDKVVLVTGAGSGIGRAAARQMAKAGAKVGVADVDGDSASVVAKGICEAGGEAVAITADVGELTEIDRMVKEATTVLGPVDVLVNNAGVTRGAYIMDLTEDDWERMTRVNAKGVFFCLQRVAQDMIASGGGRIINIASISGRGFRDASNAIYASTKGSVIGLTRHAAHQLARHNINVNSVCPGVTRTALVQNVLETRAARQGITLEEATENFAVSIPLRRLNEPEDIAYLCVYLASEAGRNITGQSFNVDGGIIMS